ncbi:putative mating-type switching protein Swi10p [[Candida] jaroonii]|uniref:Mating-type switching protein Swi10p n=1 Tax=[Candida] jaroonii TaxID=467808 RepID=A0ACA9Y674_9ASCO|nr:putative mating-type switching protein Swi10p [[Candida] jaroonii]
MDPTSFASILAGVKRMREEYGDDDKNKNEGGQGAAQQELQTEDPQTKQAPQQEEIQQPQSTSDTHVQTPIQQPTSQPRERKERKDIDSARMNRIRNGVQMYSQIQVSPSQKQNPLLQSALLKQKPITFNKEILSDYYINPNLQILFLSLKYHQLHPEYVWRRIKKLNQGSVISTRMDNSLKVLLTVIDIESPQDTLRKLNSICVKQDLTLIIAWSFEQAGNYVAMLKENELSANKVNLIIKGIKNNDFTSNMINTLTTVKTINKTDSINLIANYKNFKTIVKSDSHQIHGLGDRKIKNLKSSFSEPFIFNKEERTDDM